MYIQTILTRIESTNYPSPCPDPAQARVNVDDEQLPHLDQACQCLSLLPALRYLYQRLLAACSNAKTILVDSGACTIFGSLYVLPSQPRSSCNERTLCDSTPRRPIQHYGGQHPAICIAADIVACRCPLSKHAASLQAAVAAAAAGSAYLRLSSIISHST